ncbi:MAG: GtrA family protein [Candidatus Omnitrophica bacterium]|nr:GtrA family protein [Candidatus Omnitrophota bacterium]
MKRFAPFLKYCVVGVLGTAIDVTVLWLLVRFGGLPVLVATTISFTVSVINNFLLNKFWTFRSPSSNYRKLFIKFIIVSIGGLALTNLCMGALVHGAGIWYIWAKLITSAFVLVWNFLANKYWTFRHSRGAHHAPPAADFDFAIIVPAYNEEKRLEKTIRIIADYRAQEGLKAQIIIVDDGSTDKTAELAGRLASEIKDLEVVVSGRNEGKGNAVKQGVRAARSQKILFTDADNSTPISELANLNARLEAVKADVVIGSRYLKESRVKIKQSAGRILIGRIGNFLIRSFIINGIHDSQCGFKLFTAEAAKDIFAHTRIKRWGFDIEALAIADLRDYRIVEVPVSWYDAPNSRLRPVRDALNTFVELIFIKLNLWGGRYDAD